MSFRIAVSISVLSWSVAFAQWGSYGGDFGGGFGMGYPPMPSPYSLPSVYGYDSYGFGRAAGRALESESPGQKACLEGIQALLKQGMIAGLDDQKSKSVCQDMAKLEKADVPGALKKLMDTYRGPLQDKLVETKHSHKIQGRQGFMDFVTLVANGMKCMARLANHVVVGALHGVGRGELEDTCKGADPGQLDDFVSRHQTQGR